MTSNVNDMDSASSSMQTETLEAATWQLRALTEALGDLTLTVSDSLSVGRGSDNDVVLGSKQMSRNHAILSVLNGELYVKDLDSSNGTFINEHRIEGNKSTPLKADDSIGFASFVFQVTTTDMTPVAIVDEEADSQDTLAEPAQKETIEEVLSPVVDDTDVPAAISPSMPSTATKQETVLTHDDQSEVPLAQSPVTDAPLMQDKVVPKQPAVTPEHDKTTKTDLQLEADPDVLRAKQAATAQFSGTANLVPSSDLGTEGNNAMDQALNNPANHGHTEKSPSGGWFIWVFVAMIIIGLALWLFNIGGV